MVKKKECVAWKWAFDGWVAYFTPAELQLRLNVVLAVDFGYFQVRCSVWRGVGIRGGLFVSRHRPPAPDGECISNREYFVI